jgi:hypothetical protein
VDSEEEYTDMTDQVFPPFVVLAAKLFAPIIMATKSFAWEIE